MDSDETQVAQFHIVRPGGCGDAAQAADSTSGKWRERGFNRRSYQSVEGG
jgi:hypothetical protein